ncbi:Uncharacterized protein conserved in archaea [Geoglobus ahangari]|uniref:Uncharacterized protein conserved in archaea n=1 Tax=Geoglobus ahangari TaxID=113653 RepID=A0A0F7IFZ7_9EURY|nr:DUF166 family protein [Geoglobus ahangari]AKG92078.1 Uncharacterized protein conserved in archaea [Geoglobus ahangari]
MEIGIIYSGEFGRRFVSNLTYPDSCPHFGACGIDECDHCKSYDLSSSIVFARELEEPSTYGVYIEEPERIVGEVECEVLVAINLHPDIIAELPEFAGVKCLIVPVEHPAWLSVGLREQVRRKCEEVGIEFYAPKPFCASNTPLADLGFGKPEFRVKMDGNVVEQVEVVRSDPCGNAYYVARRMRGYEILDVGEFWKDIHQHQCAYPCLASMERDAEIREAPFHLAGYVMVYQFSKACGVDAESFVPEHMKKFVLDSV